MTSRIGSVFMVHFSFSSCLVSKKLAWSVASTLQVNFTPLATLGSYTMIIGPQILSASGSAMDQNRNGVAGQVPSDEFSANFEYFPAAGDQLDAISLSSVTGTDPQAGLAIDSSGNLFGTTMTGGANNDGTLFEIPRGTTAAVTLVNFGGGYGIHPTAGVVFDSAGDLFGTTFGGGNGSFGTIFEMPHGASTITILYSFNNNYVYGWYPNAVTLDSSGDLFGTTETGGASNHGAVFELPRGATTITVLASFNSTNGTNPQAGVAIDSSGTLFGTAYQGGTSAGGYGTVFELRHNASTLNVLVNFSNANGSWPWAAPVIDSSGNLFGATY